MKWLNILQILVSAILIASILLQQRGSSLGSAFGGDSAVFRTKRGIEKSLFITSIVLSVLFIGSSLAAFLLS